MDNTVQDTESAWKFVFRALGLVYGLFLLGVVTIMVAG